MVNFKFSILIILLVFFQSNAAEPHPQLGNDTFYYANPASEVRTHQPFFIVSPPKCGTFLSGKVLALLTLRTPALYLSDFGSDRQSYKKVKNELAANRFVVTHEIHPAVAERLVQRGYKIIFVIRDPRDQLISVLNWIREGEWPWLAISKYKNFSTQLHEAISGVRTGWRCYNSCFLKYENAIKELPKESVLYVRYENLVGPNGGGTLESQASEISAICNFIELDILDEERERMLSQIYGGTITFRSGQVGSWKEYLLYFYKEMYKFLYQDELIRLGYEVDENW